jgi:two-component sensor histidine kinase
MGRSLAVLMIEDSERDALLLLHHLEISEYRIVSERIETAEELTNSLRRTTWDVVLSDFSLPGFDAAEALSILMTSGLDTPFIIVSGAIGEETAVALMKAGAHDYIMKSNLARLLPAIEREIAEALVRKERIVAEEKIRLSLREKEIMLKEIHHRVKNNLQIICSLLHLQQEKIPGAEMQQLFLETQQRVRSMALVHDKLYNSPSLARIDFGDYVRSMSNELLRSYVKPGIVISTDIINISFGVDTAIPCGLIVNELLSNALKHGFPDSRAGNIQVSVKYEKPEDYVLTVSDDGIGFPPEFNVQNTDTLGTQIVCSLVSQLNGTCQMENRGGAMTIIQFSVPARAERPQPTRSEKCIMQQT